MLLFVVSSNSPISLATRRSIWRRIGRYRLFICVRSGGYPFRLWRWGQSSLSHHPPARAGMDHLPCRNVTKIESFTSKQGIAEVVTLAISMADLAPWQDWRRQMTVQVFRNVANLAKYYTLFRQSYISILRPFFL